MTTQEFSNTFDTLLNSYASKAIFGDQASHQEIVLDEYEKSVLLTQAQDIVVKQYFSQSSVSEGFDGSARRQIDFSSLISVAQIAPSQGASNQKFAEKSWLFELPTAQVTLPEGGDSIASKVLFILNEKLVLKKADNPDKTYVVVPINYLEYDRKMSKPFSQPLKKQCWRLLQDNNSAAVDGTLYAEIVPTDAADTLVGSSTGHQGYSATYRIRYVRRPRPIVLVDLTDAGLSVDGTQTITECELNPILHIDVLNKAVELALSTRGGRVPARDEQK